MSTGLALALLGTGRMGAAVAAIAEERGHGVVARFGSADAATPLPPGTDVAIDFSRADAVLLNARKAAAARCGLVLGTTGWDRDAAARDALAAAVREAGIGAVVAPNFSFGMHLFRKLVQEAARLAADDHELDLWLEEEHHRLKADHPSGTALSLARGMLERLPRKTHVLSALPDGPVPRDALVVAVSRGGYEPGTHRVVLDAPEETVTLEHRVRSRRTFALGAVRAAEWVRGRRGLFTLDDVLRSES